MSSSAQLANAVQGARAIAAQGDIRGAHALLDQAVEAAGTALGVDDPDVLAATCLLARFHVDLGELADARRVLEEGLAAGYHRLGDGHAVMLALSFELARIADELGNVYEAKRRYGQLARFGPAALGDDHPGVRAARAYLGLPEPAAPQTMAQAAPPATFDPVTAPTGMQAPPLRADPAPTWPVGVQADAPVADDHPVFRPEPRDEPAAEPDDDAQGYDEPGYAEPANNEPAHNEPAHNEPAYDEYDGLAAEGDREPEDDYVPAPWQRSAPGVLQRTAPAQLPGLAGGPGSPAAPPLPSPTAAAGRRTRRRSPLLALLVILAVAVLGGLTAAVVSFVAASPGGDGPPAQRSQAAQPEPSGAAPTSGSTGNPNAPASVRLRDDKTSITLTWTDPSKGTVPFIVAGGQQGALRQLQVLAAGSTTYTINGLNPKLEYCFTVAAVYGTSNVELSDLTCTRRT